MADKPAPGDDRILHMLGFMLGEEVFCLDLAQVQEVLLYAQPTPLKNLPPFVKGFLSVRGEMVPVFDLAEILGLPPVKPMLNSAIIISRAHEVRAGLVVDRIYNLLRVERASCIRTPASLEGMNLDYIPWAASLGERLAFIVDLGKILASHRLAPAKEAVQGIHE